jgi:AraC-like DNA-binding protein
MEYIPLVRASLVKCFATFLTRAGRPVEQLLGQSRLPDLVLEDPEALVPLHRACEFAERAARTEGLQTLGLRVGRQTPLAMLGSYGRAIRRSATLHDAIEAASRLGPGYSSGEHVWLSRHGEQARLCHRYLDGVRGGVRQTEQFTLMMMVGLLRWVAGPDWRPETLELHAVPRGDVTGMAVFCGTRVSSGHGQLAVTFPRALLSLPLPRGNNHLAIRSHHGDASDGHASEEPPAPATDLADSVRQLIGTYLREGYPDLQRIAESTGMSERTLQRRLTEAGVSYSQLVDEARLTAASRYLSDPQIKVIDVAMELGFSDAANFTRAFRRWTGVAPSQFRHLGARAPMPRRSVAA